MFHEQEGSVRADGGDVTFHVLLVTLIYEAVAKTIDLSIAGKQCIYRQWKLVVGKKINSKFIVLQL